MLPRVFTRRRAKEMVWSGFPRVLKMNCDLSRNQQLKDLRAMIVFPFICSESKLFRCLSDRQVYRLCWNASGGS
jgi:hypothetical protein